MKGRLGWNQPNLSDGAYLEDSRKLPCSDIGVDVQQLSILGLGQTGQDGQTSGSNGRLDRSLVDRRDLSDKAVLLLIQVGGSEDAGRNRSGSRAETFEGRGELEVLLQKDPLKKE